MLHYRKYTETLEYLFKIHMDEALKGHLISVRYLRPYTVYPAYIHDACK